MQLLTKAVTGRFDCVSSRGRLGNEGIQYALEDDPNCVECIESCTPDHPVRKSIVHEHYVCGILTYWILSIRLKDPRPAMGALKLTTANIVSLIQGLNMNARAPDVCGTARLGLLSRI